MTSYVILFALGEVLKRWATLSLFPPFAFDKRTLLTYSVYSQDCHWTC